MNKRLATVTIIVLILVLIGYIVVDVALKEESVPISSQAAEGDTPGVTDQWIVSRVFEPGKGQLNAVAVSTDGKIFLAGEPYIACYDPGFNLLWEYRTEMPVTALTVSGNNLYAAVQEIILVLNTKGEKTDEWGPFENNSLITSLACNGTYLAFADAATKTIFVLDMEGNVKSIIGKSGEPFIIPSAYFDIALGGDNVLYAANTGKRRIERRNIDGTILDFFGEEGTGPEAFFGCCNPSHFALLPGGFITAEKGMNRIKILDRGGRFVEYVSSVNNFVKPLPLDIASADGEIIFGANPADSKVYVFRRK